jgi:hypothetical protein
MVVRSGSDIEARFARGPTEGTYLAGCLQKAIELVPYDQLVTRTRTHTPTHVHAD